MKRIGLLLILSIGLGFTQISAQDYLDLIQNPNEYVISHLNRFIKEFRLTILYQWKIRGDDEHNTISYGKNGFEIFFLSKNRIYC